MEESLTALSIEFHGTSFGVCTVYTTFVWPEEESNESVARPFVIISHLVTQLARNGNDFHTIRTGPDAPG